MKEIISITLVIIGALVGAGFASGQEIFSFFYVYGKNGIFGIIIMCLLMGFLIYKTLKIAYLNFAVPRSSHIKFKFHYIPILHNIVFSF